MANAECDSQLINGHNRCITPPFFEAANVLLAEVRFMGSGLKNEILRRDV